MVTSYFPLLVALIIGCLILGAVFLSQLYFPGNTVPLPLMLRIPVVNLAEGQVRNFTLKEQYIALNVLRTIRDVEPVSSCGYKQLGDVVVDLTWDTLYTFDPSHHNVAQTRAIIVYYQSFSICQLLSIDYERVPNNGIIIVIGGNENGNLLTLSHLQTVASAGSLMSGCSNHTGFNEVYTWLDNSKLIAIFTIQAVGTAVSSHPKVYMLPLGFRGPHCISNTLERYGTTKLRTFLEDSLTKVKHADLSLRMSRSLGRSAIIETLRKNWNYSIDLYRGQSDSKTTLDDFRETLVTSVFTASPEGMGPDCYRHCEALLLGCIPLIDNPYVFKSFTNLPAVFIADWRIVTPTFLRRWETILHAERKFWNFQKLTQRYWLDWIRRTANDRILLPPR